MPVITLPDGSRREFEQPVTVLEVARSIGAGLARAALAGRVDGRLVDLSHVIAGDAALALITERDAEGLDVIRHSSAHLLAHAVARGGAELERQPLAGGVLAALGARQTAVFTCLNFPLKQRRLINLLRWQQFR